MDTVKTGREKQDAYRKEYARLNICRILSSFLTWLEDEKPSIVDAIQD